MDVITYDDWSEENHSIERISASGYSGDPDNWKESLPGGTPGKENSITSMNTCDWSIQTVMNSTVSIDPTWKIRATRLSGDTKANLTIALWVEDTVGFTVKNYSAIIVENALTQSTSGDYTPALTPGQGYIIKANITNISCADSNRENNDISDLIFIPSQLQSLSNESHITITELPSTARFGDIVTATVDIYRGDTAKFAVNAVIKNSDSTVSETTTLHLTTKLTNYTLKIPLQIRPNCEERYKDSKYDLLIEGLGVSESKSIRLEGTKSSSCKTESKTTVASSNSPKKSVNYELLSNLDSLTPGEPTNVQVKLIGDDKDHTVDIWAHLYRGPKTYSEPIQKQTIRLGPLEEQKATIPLFINKSVDDGTYKLKVLFRKDGQKTTHDITQDVIVRSQQSVACEDLPASQGLGLKENFNKKPGLIIYESSSIKASGLAPILFSIAMTLLSVALVFKKI
jgi:hypothetical protein